MVCHRNLLRYDIANITNDSNTNLLSYFMQDYQILCVTYRKLDNPHIIKIIYYILKPIVLSSSKCRCNTIGIRKFIRLQNSFLSSQGRQTAIIIVLVF